MRPSGREHNQLRAINITRNYTKHAEGSVLIEYGDTKVLCNASVIPGVPKFLKNTGQGWVTAEYAMLPRATCDRMQREVTRGAPGGRTLEIQRLIARSLRSMIDLKLIGENTITVDCDVIQADGGTRTASITGGCIALVDALNFMLKNRQVTKNPIKNLIAAVSVGIYNNTPIVDLDYAEDSNAETDMNVIMNEHGDFVEIQGTAENNPFSAKDLNAMLEIASFAIADIVRIQKQILA